MSNSDGHSGASNDGWDAGAFQPDYPLDAPYSQPEPGYPEPTGFTQSYPEPTGFAQGYPEPTGSVPPSYPSAPNAYPPPAPAWGPTPTPYNAAPYGLPPDNNLVWGILTTLMCCMPLGIPSIVYATQVNTKWAMGDHAGAQDSAKKARQFAIWAAIGGAAFYVLYFGFIIVMATVNP